MSDNALIVLGTALTPELVFGKPGGVDAALGAIKAEVRGTKTDISTKAGRDQIRSLAYKIARSKTLLDNMGKDLVSDLKAKTGAIDAERRRIRDELDALQEEFRKPLTDFEEAEKSRVAGYEAAIAELAALGRDIPSGSSAIGDRLARAREFGHNRDWQEFAARAAETRSITIEALTAAQQEAIAREAAEAEAECARQEEVARQQREREARLCAEAAEKARREAEAHAAAEARAAEERARREREAIEAKARAEREARERAEREKAAAEARARQAEEQRIAAERRAKHEAEEAARRAERERQEAIAAELRRAEAERVRAEQEAMQREADRQHRGKINGAARDALIAGGLSDGAATTAITLIAGRKIPHVTIAY